MMMEGGVNSCALALSRQFVDFLATNFRHGSPGIVG
jgi:hypothetical protein